MSGTLTVYTEWRRWLEAIAAGAGGDWDVPAVMRELETPRVLDSKPSGARLWRVARALGIDKRKRLEWNGNIGVDPFDAGGGHAEVCASFPDKGAFNAMYGRHNVDHTVDDCKGFAFGFPTREEAIECLERLLGRED